MCLRDRFELGTGPKKLAVKGLERQDGRFHMEGGSRTNNTSRVRGYENLLRPMHRVGAIDYGKGSSHKSPRMNSAVATRSFT